MSLRLGRNKTTGHIDIFDPEDEDNNIDVTNDFYRCVVQWLEANDEKTTISCRNITYKITMKTWFHVKDEI